MDDGIPASRQTQVADAGTHSTNRQKAEPAALRGLSGNKDEANMWTSRTRSSTKCVPSRDFKTAT